MIHQNYLMHLNQRNVSIRNERYLNRPTGGHLATSGNIKNVPRYLQTRPAANQIAAKQDDSGGVFLL